VTWKAAALDGAELPPAQATVGPAVVGLAVGQTADFLFEPAEPGVYRLGLTVFRPSAPQGIPTMEQRLIVVRR
jgi:hypothetical protein